MPIAPQARGEVEKQKTQLGPPKKTASQVVGAVNKPAPDLAKVHRDEVNLTPFKVPVARRSLGTRGHSHPTQKDQGLGRIELSMMNGPRTMDCHTLRRQLQELVNQDYLQKFVSTLSNPRRPR